MSSFYDDASLVMIPSCYKVGTVLCEKPTDGSGDLTFTRTGDTATRIAPNGLLEKVRTNLILQSQAFDNASWGKDTTTVTANAEVAPDGTLTADTMTISTDASRVTQGPTIGAGSFTASVYVKIISQTTAGDIRFLGVVDGSVLNVNFTPTNQWARYTATFTAATQITSFQLRGVTGGFVGTIAIWGFQLEASDFKATDYIPTTTAAVSVGPVANLPRLDYLGSSCPRLLLEPQRTNSQTYSEDLTQATAWGLGATTVSANATTSPDGYQNADKLVETATTARHELYGKTLTFSGTTSLSFYAKAAGRRYFSAFVAGNPALGGATYDLQTGTITATSGGTTANIEAVSGATGWYRCSFTTTAAASTTLYICLRTTGGAPNIEPYAGDGTSGVYFWGGQTELAGAYATSYIPTLAASATRGADACSKTGISSLIGQTEGSIYFEGSSDTIGGSTNLINFNFAVNSVVINRQSTGVIRALINTASAIILDSSPVSGIFKVAIGYKNGDSVLYVNGTLAASSTNSFTFATALTEVNLGTGVAYFAAVNQSKCNQALLFKTRLTNAELAELTTL